MHLLGWKNKNQHFNWCWALTAAVWLNGQSPIYSDCGLTASLQLRNNGAQARASKFPQITLPFLLSTQASWALCTSFKWPFELNWAEFWLNRAYVLFERFLCAIWDAKKNALMDVTVKQQKEQSRWRRQKGKSFHTSTFISYWNSNVIDRTKGSSGPKVQDCFWIYFAQKYPK